MATAKQKETATIKKFTTMIKKNPVVKKVAAKSTTKKSKS